jgi:dipeptidyl aminopeptidase/acylaminoacyl peptidase
MTRGFFIIACLLVFRTYGAPRQYALDELLPRTRIQGLSFSPEGSEAVISWNTPTGTKMASVSMRTGLLKPIETSSAGSALPISFFPGDKRILYAGSGQPDRGTNWCVIEPRGNSRALTDDPLLNAQFAGWTCAGDAFHLLTSGLSSYKLLQRFDAASYEKTVIYTGSLDGLVKAVSCDAQWIALESGNISLFHIPSHSRQTLSQRPSSSRYYVAGFDPASRWLYYLTDEGENFLRVRRHELTTGKQEDVQRADSDIVASSFSRNGKYRATIIDREGSHELKLYETASGKEVRLKNMPRGSITNVTISPNEKVLAFYTETDRSPRSLYVCDLRTGRVQRLTDVLDREVKRDDLVESRSVRFNSYDGLSIHCLLYKPQQATTKRKAPALVWLHGGPASQLRTGYEAHLQYLVNRGFVVLGVNYRGSTGYGATFAEANEGKHWADPVLDCIEARKFLGGLPFVDTNRIGIIGESFGGYLVLAALAFHPDTFKVGVDLSGVVNWLRVVKDANHAFKERRALDRLIGDPKTDAERLRTISPVFHADKIRRPLFVLQGAKDPKIPKDETDKLVQTVKTNGVPIEYLVFDDEGHSIEKRENYLDAWDRILRFLQAHL